MVPELLNHWTTEALIFLISLRPDETRHHPAGQENRGNPYKNPLPGFYSMRR
jgi:hypothetical protein